MVGVGKGWFRGYLRATIIGVIAAAVVIPLGCVLIFIPMGIAVRGEGTTGTIVLAISSTLFLLITVGGALLVAALIISRRVRWLDRLFTPLGLSGSMYQLYFRQYQGVLQGRRVRVRFRRGPTLELYASTSLQTRLSIATRDTAGLAIAHMFNREPLALDDPTLGDLSVFALDEKWARTLLANPEARAALRRLIDNDNSFVLRQVYLRPGEFCLYLYGSRQLWGIEIAPAQARQWLDDLLTLARVAESVPPPQITAQASSLELAARSGRFTHTAAMIVVAVFVGLPLCAIIPIIALLWVLTNQ